MPLSSEYLYNHHSILFIIRPLENIRLPFLWLVDVNIIPYTRAIYYSFTLLYYYNQPDDTYFMSDGILTKTLLGGWAYDLLQLIVYSIYPH